MFFGVCWYCFLYAWLVSMTCVFWSRMMGVGSWFIHCVMVFLSLVIVFPSFLRFGLCFVFLCCCFFFPFFCFLDVLFGCCVLCFVGVWAFLRCVLYAAIHCYTFSIRFLYAAIHCYTNFVFSFMFYSEF